MIITGSAKTTSERQAVIVSGLFKTNGGGESQKMVNTFLIKGHRHMERGSKQMNIYSWGGLLGRESDEDEDSN